MLTMRNLHLLDAYRITDPHALKLYGGWAGDHECGAFRVPSCIDKQPVMIVASVGEGWDHVSVSRRTRTPNWTEMEQIAALFFKDDETAMQLHVPSSDHVNNHEYCLHWWRPLNAEIPRPPAILVGVKEAGTLTTPEESMALHNEVLRNYR
jgi:hypothetical protein